ncbi:extradiol ring-cleavage dioxygenase isoform X2 [Physcomitrium patens]|nr:extradiol ring-cleavage dioxygenase-like isoform X2 [Physcomitrium patens]CAE47099.1 4,5 dioxygenase extradiol [Physcomitrium patens]|eukprot:XP_024399007.1 extradiol ring-cleavage dioxygenase-like isoform X2 [Physcomitrella patens]
MATSAGLSTFYVSHGSPMMPLEDTPIREFFSTWTERYPTRPKAILAISAHWDTREPAVNAVSQNSTIHDFYGFPRELYQLQYTPPGAPDVAKRVTSLLKDAGFKTVLEDNKRGLDHGAWTPLMLMYPNADIPVLQVSIQSNKDGLHHYQLGRALAPLKDEGVLIFASGTTVHNLREIDFSAKKPTVWAKAFDGWLTDVLLNSKHKEAMEWEKAPYASKAHPHPDHFLPVLVGLGAAGEQCQAEKIYEEFAYGLALSCFAFHPQN